MRKPEDSEIKVGRGKTIYMSLCLTTIIENRGHESEKEQEGSTLK